ncbi:unnamed protein product [Fraxinus pennsylvanica]|uniref:Uncharacterized protein n=1 Tax=Fraxinus pennsylvanica TaxID=56036 RepID=A0AAD1YZB8_9LAMI|nr:unnamed protein product [Fraxinus pennsylvanica]
MDRNGFDFGFSSNVQFSALIFSHALDRKYAFLLCNGILAFLAKSLSFSSSSNGENMNPVSESKEAAPPEDNEESAIIYDTEKLAISQEEKDHKEKQEEVEERESRVLIVESEEEDEDDEEESGLIIDGEEEGIKDDVKVSTEELNKKFEEFIRKMKEEIRIAAV